jgi:hypothetical protein
MRFRRRGPLLPNGEREIIGHPDVEAFNSEGKSIRISVCSDCGSIRTILYLSKDRWLCTACRSEGDARPTQVPVSRPRG